MNQHVCLAMIVKNEAHVIERCLASVVGLVDEYVIVDTGSTDDTIAKIEAFMRMKGVIGSVHTREWRGFADARNEAIFLAEDTNADYILMIDADDQLIGDPQRSRPHLDKAYYNLKIKYGNIEYSRPQLFCTNWGFRFRGVLHEFLDIPNDIPQWSRDGEYPYHIQINHDGARSKDPKTYANDAAMLVDVLQNETDPFMRSRYTFYLAQSYRDAGMGELAGLHYTNRTEMGYWNEEVYVSWLNIGRLLAGRNNDAAYEAWGNATRTCPHRAEAVYEVVRSLRLRGEYHDGARIAQLGINLSAPSGLFVEPWVYQYGLLDEYSICAFYSGEYHASLLAAIDALTRGSPDVERVTRNMRFAAAKLG